MLTFLGVPCFDLKVKYTFIDHSIRSTDPLLIHICIHYYIMLSRANPNVTLQSQNLVLLHILVCKL